MYTDSERNHLNLPDGSRKRLQLHFENMFQGYDFITRLLKNKARVKRFTIKSGYIHSLDYFTEHRKIEDNSVV